MRSHIADSSATRPENATRSLPAGSARGPSSDGRLLARSSRVVVVAVVAIAILSATVGLSWRLFAPKRRATVGDPIANGTGADRALTIGHSGMPDPSLTPEQSARMRVNQALAALETSGPATSELISSGQTAIDAWKHHPLFAGVEFGDFRCFQAGCRVTSTHSNLTSASSVGDQFLRAEGFLAWPGGKFRSGPLPLPSGQVQFVWILYKETAPPTRETKETP